MHKIVAHTCAAHTVLARARHDYPPTMRYVAAYVASAVLFGLLDAVWLGKVGRGLYDDRLGSLLADKPNLTAALAFYAIYLVGLTYFVTGPALEAGSPARAAVGGALLGLVAYAT